MAHLKTNPRLDALGSAPVIGIDPLSALDQGHESVAVRVRVTTGQGKVTHQWALSNNGIVTRETANEHLAFLYEGCEGRWVLDAAWKFAPAIGFYDEDEF